MYKILRTDGHYLRSPLMLKMYRIMKVTSLFMLALLVQVQAESFAQQVTLKKDNAPLKEIFREIHNQTGYIVLYRTTLLKGTHPVAVDLRQESLSQSMTKILAGQDLDFTIEGREIIIRRKERTAAEKVRNPSTNEEKSPRQFTVTGIVTDTTGFPLPGVTVQVKGISMGTSTDLEGSFTLSNIDEQAILTFSYMGYQTLEIPVVGQSNFNIILRRDTQTLNEVVVVGYGEERRVDMTGSIASIKAEDLEKSVYNTVDQTLQGRIAGVHVMQASAEPGGAVSVRIRGSNSISGNNEPLYVVDGFPMAEADEAEGPARSTQGNGLVGLNPDDILSIEVLKDASATAIYGSRGANGVVLITTKRGPSEKSSIEVSSKTGISRMTNTGAYKMMDGPSYAAYVNETFLQQNPNAEPDEMPYDLSKLPDRSINWMDLIARDAIRQEYNVRVRSSTAGSSYMISSNYLSEDAVLIGSDLQRGTLRGNLQTRVNERIQMGLNLTASRTKSKRAITDGRGFPNQASPILYALRASPLMGIREETDPLQMLEDDEGNEFFNPYIELTQKTDNTHNDILLGNVDLKIRLGKGLDFNTNAGAHHTYSKREVFLPKNVGRGRVVGGEANVAEYRRYNYVISNVLNFRRTLGSHRINAMAGTEYTQSSRARLRVVVNDFDMDELGVDNLSYGVERTTTASDRTKYILESYFTRLNYNFDDRLLLTFTGRADGSSKFAKNNKWAYFPSGAVAWNVSNERFMSELKAVSAMKLRMSYGATGSQAISPYQSLAVYNVSVYPMDNQHIPVIVSGSVANPDLRWETTNQFDAGIDLELFDGRLGLVADYYHKNTRNLLQTVNLPQQSGLVSALVNMGTIENWGWEFNLGWQITDGPGFKWSSDINYTRYKTVVKDLGDNVEIFGPPIGTNNYVGTAGHIYKTGWEYGLFYGHQVIGLIQPEDFDEHGDPLFAVMDGDTRLGHWKFEDVNGDGEIDLLDRKVLGSSNPEHIFGWINDFTYKNISLNIFLRGQFGNHVINPLYTWLNSGLRGGWNQTQAWWDNRWSEENIHNDIHYPSGNNPPGSPNSAMLQNGSFIRLQSASLSYRVPLKSRFISQAQVSLTGTNLFIITKYRGFDPEVSMLGHNTLAPGVDMGAYPMSRNLVLGVKVTL